MNTVTATRRALPGDDMLVLHRRPLRDGVVAERTSRFADDQWRLEDAVLQRHGLSMMLDFTTLPARYRLTVKHLCYALLSGPLPPGERRVSITTVVRIFGELKRFFAWLNTFTPTPGRQAGPMLAELRTADLERFQLHLLEVLPSPAGRYSARRAVRFFWRYRHNLPADRLLIDPRHVDGWGEPSRPVQAENATDRIPGAVLGPLIAWALRFIDDFGPDILAAETHRRMLHERRRANTPGRYTGATVALRELLARHLRHNRPLPGHRGNPNMGFLALVLGCDVKTLERLRPEVDAAGAVAGIDSYSWFDLPITGRLDGQPWIEAIASDHRYAYGLAALSRMLQAATYVALSFLSGMRDSEIKHLRRGCLHVERDADGTPYRWKVTSLAFKGEDDPAGVPATWVIGAPAARAINVLEQLHPPGTDLLFAPVNGPGSGPSSRAKNEVLSSGTSNDQLNDFVVWVNDYCALRGRLDGIPPVAGRPWRLATSQFRRTLAWFIARRPGGAIAGAIAYRHLSVQMFEGYAGTSESGFRAEVESEQALARGEHLLAMTDAHQHTDLTGPSAAEAARRLEEFADHARFGGTVITDRHRLKRLIDRQDPAVYPGTYVTCVHDHAKALCQKRRDASGRDRPDLGTCRPLQCRNVALTGDNITAWTDEIHRIDQRLAARPPLPPLLEHQLRERRNELTNFLARHQETP